MPEPVTLTHWTYRHPCNRALVSERYSLVADDGRRLVTRSTEIEARRAAREQGWTVVGDQQQQQHEQARTA